MDIFLRKRTSKFERATFDFRTGAHPVNLHTHYENTTKYVSYVQLRNMILQFAFLKTSVPKKKHIWK